MVGCRMNVKKTALAMLAICFAFASPGDAKVYHVNASAVASGDGSSWSAPLDEAGFAVALNGAASGDEFWIAVGSYRPVVPASTDAVTAAEQGESFTLRDGVALYGFFHKTPSQGGSWTWNLKICIEKFPISGFPAKYFTIAWMSASGT